MEDLIVMFQWDKNVVIFLLMSKLVYENHSYDKVGRCILFY